MARVVWNIPSKIKEKLLHLSSLITKKEALLLWLWNEPHQSVVA